MESIRLLLRWTYLPRLNVCSLERGIDGSSSTRQGSRGRVFELLGDWDKIIRFENRILYISDSSTLTTGSLYAERFHRI
jgi:hypothetical protein